MGDRQVFYWDWVAEAFRQTTRRVVELPLLGPTNITSVADADLLTVRWINAAKLLTEPRKSEAIRVLGHHLGVAPPQTAPHGTQLDWQDIGNLADSCFDFGSHTVNHPILARIDLAEAENEITGSRLALETALSRPVQSFAYPNGLAGDFGADHEALLERHGFSVAFRGSGGLTFSAERRRRRFSLFRTCVNLKDTLPVVAGKAAGLGRVVSPLS